MVTLKRSQNISRVEAGSKSNFSGDFSVSVIGVCDVDRDDAEILFPKLWIATNL
jgi:hypothetical protein